METEIGYQILYTIPSTRERGMNVRRKCYA